MRRLAGTAACLALLAAAALAQPAAGWTVGSGGNGAAAGWTRGDSGGRTATAGWLLEARGGGAAAAASAECTWRRHTKRVVTHVRRHGKRRRLVRRRHWWTRSCPPGPETPAGGPAPAPGPAPSPSPAPEEEPVANRLGVRASEYYFTLSRASVAAGQVTIELDNRGEDAHDLNLQRQGGGSEPVLEIAETQSLQHSVASFDLPPGTYQLWCSLPTHREKGMETTLVVGG
ncbi:MAG: hypothetical protein U0R71_11565 [Solirubrobacterales bacterium]